MPDIDDSVVQGLYEAAAGTLEWNPALAALDSAIGNVIGSQVVVVEKSTGQLLLSEQPDHTPPDAVLEYIREYHRSDPHVPYLVTRPIGETIHTEDVFPPVEYVDHPFYRDFWRPYNVRSFVGAKVAEDERCVSCIGVMRALDVPPYGQAEIELAGRYFRHLAAAMRISGFLNRIRALARVGYDLMAMSERPMVLIDEHRTILAANPPARHVLAERRTLVARDEILHCATSENQRALERALVGLFGASGGTPAGSRGRTALRLKSHGSTDGFLSLWRLKPEETMGAFGSKTLALVTLAAHHEGMQADPMLLAAMFDLTPAEVRVAQALMNGSDPEHIAQQHGVAISTVRSQLKSLFAKTNTHRQAMLVQLLLTSVLL